MDEKAQRIAIAKACGRYRQWVATTKSNPSGNWRLGGCSQNTWDKSLAEKWANDRNGFVVEVEPELGDFPDYLRDLNACHEMEKTLGPQQLACYLRYLADACEGKDEGDINGWAYHCTAAQRGEAFLRTLNLWED